jgi:Zn-dependent metalloprotease
MKTYANLFRVIGFILLTSCLLQLGMAQQVFTFKNKRGHMLEARIDDKTGTATHILGLRDDIRDYGVDKTQVNQYTIDIIAKRLISDYSSILKVTPDIVQLKKADTDGSWWFVEYEQTLAGIPVYGSEIGFSVDPQGNIVTLGAFAFPSVSVSSQASVAADLALSTAKREFQMEKTTVKSYPELFILPVEKVSDYAYRLVWRTELSSVDFGRDTVYFINAHTGKIVKRFSNVRHDVIYGTVTGNY